jgi:hypothetical protein
VAVVTGVVAEIGKTTERVLVREGAKVLAVDFSGAGKKLAAQFGCAAIPFHAACSFAHAAHPAEIQADNEPGHVQLRKGLQIMRATADSPPL